ncbi:hypothetical protein GOP47_0009743 [Adiantum capillus-veneris]|uniref:Uncharacterized protein n=1 Tax=Adiantum capillus-veneris TaxID=13818 RepID=A0A9D4ZJ01_ADICA|nr:hypothetical protein GOP47_0009743 [Adiantum capillus-veneris]
MVGGFCRADVVIPTYNREAREKVSPRMFPASRRFLMEEHQECTIVLNIPMRDGAERSLDFYTHSIFCFKNVDIGHLGFIVHVLEVTLVALLL